MIDEPLKPGWNALFFTKTSPYVDRINEVLRRLSESGLIEWWINNEKKQLEVSLRPEYKELFKNKETSFFNSEIYGSNIINTWFYINMTFLCLISCLLAFLVFACEVIHKEVVTKLRKLIPRNLDI